MRHLCALLALSLLACSPRPVEEPRSTAAAATPAPSAPPLAAQAPPPVAPVPEPPRSPAPTVAAYPWLADVPPPADALDDRFAPPPGFARVALAAGTFGAWLRHLPLAPPGSPVLTHEGAVLRRADHDHVAAVADLDIGARDLQQCADSIIRLHAEWLYAQGRRDASYRAASGSPMPFARWARGERMRAEGMSFTWGRGGGIDDGHASYRKWLDAVFTWANTGSLARDTERVDAADLRPGDFVVQPGAPGHAVLVLDLARAPDGRRALLLGQGFMPAQSFHVLHPGKRGASSAWFLLDASSPGLDTPFWSLFPWSALRRFAGT
jgi:hypothetical protein